MEIVVVGAGLGGLAAAVALHRAGHAVAVLERAAALREDGAGIGLPPNGVLALDALGLGGPVRERAVRFARGGLLDRHGRALMSTDQRAIEALLGAPMAVVPRRWLHELLTAALPPGTVRPGSAVADVREDAEGVVVAGYGRADAVVAADGARSRLRAALFPTHPGLRGTGEHAARTIATAPAGTDLPVGELLDHRTGDRVGCLPLGGGEVYRYSTWRARAPEDPDARHRWLLDRRADWHPAVVALVAATPASAVHVVETAQLDPLPSFTAGRVALLGDAAHAMTPDLGQGACQAFEDAVTLAAVLGPADPDRDGPDRDVAGLRVAAAFARYDTARRPRTTTLSRQARSTNRLLTRTGPAGRLRDAVLRGVPDALATRALARQMRFAPPVRAAQRSDMPT